MVKDALRIAELEKLLAERTAETIQMSEQLSVINSVQEALVKEMDLQAIYDLVGNRIQELFDAQCVIIGTFDIENETEDFQYVFENGERFYPEGRPLDKLRKHLIETKQKFVFNTEEETFEWLGKKVVGDTKLMKSGVFVPLITGDKVTSYISLQNVEKENAFSDSEIRLLETLANSMSTALENARLLKETEQRTAELAVINSVQEGLAKELDIQAIYDLVGNRIRELFDAQVVGIATFDHVQSTETLHYLIEKGERYYPTPKPINSLRRHIITSREKLVINKSFSTVADTFGIKPVPGTQQPKSAVYVPMLLGDKITGYVSLQNIDKENAFSESDLRLLETLANSMGVALENARLFDETNRLLKETEQQKAELGVINSVQEGLAKELDMQAIYDLVGDRIRQLFNAQAVIIANFDHDSATEHFKYLIEDGQRFYLASRPYDKLRQHIIINKQKIVINSNYAEAYGKFGLKTLPGTNMTKSGVFVPLIIGDKVNSYISLQNNETENAFSESDIRLLETLANSMSVALENARLFDETTRLLKETEQRTAELAVINSVQEGLARELDMNAIYDLVGNKIRDVFDAQAVVIATFDHDNGTEKFNFLFEKGERYFAEPRRYDKLRYQLIMSKQKILINNNVEEAFAEFGLKVVQGTEMPKSLLYVPLIVGNKVTSYVSLQNVDKNNAFSDADVRLLETLANSMSVALENARLFDETNRLLKETEQGKAELAVINSVQAGLVKEMDIQGIYNLVGDRIQKLFTAQVVIIATFDHERRLEYFNYHFEKGEVSHPDPRQFDKVRQHLIETGQNILINKDVLKAVSEFGLRVVPGTEMPKSLLFMPLKVADKVNGYVSLQNIDEENAFSFSDVRLLSTLSNSMSVALENARLFDETNRLLKETEQRTAELSVINSVQGGLAKEIDMHGIYELVGEKIREIFDAQVIDIVTYDSKTNLLEDRYAYEKGDRTLVGKWEPSGFRKHVIEKGELLLVNENLEKIASEFSSLVIHGEQPKSAVFVPMISGGNVTGMISLQNLDHEHAFTDSNVNLLTTLSHSMSIALESARRFDETNRLLKETEQRNAELAVINSVQESLVAKMDMQGIYELVGEKIREIFDAQVIDIVMYNSKDNLIKDRYSYEKGDRSLLPSREPKGFRKHVIQSKQLLLHNENVEQAMLDFDNEILIGECPKSQIYVPMIAGGEVKGIISLQNLDHEHAFSDSDVSLITTLANSMSVALESARLFDETTRLLSETEQRTAELSVINSVQEGLAKELDIQGIYELVGEKMREIFNAQVIDIATYDSKANLMELHYSYEKGDRSLVPPWKPEGFRKHIIETGQPLVINEDLDKRASEFNSKVISGAMPKSMVFVPLISGNEVKGMISLQNIDEENAFSESAVSLLTTLTNSMIVALENARLFDETNRLLKETEQRNAELAVINSVQESLVAKMDIQGIYELVGEKIREIFDAQVIDIVTYDPVANLIEDRYAFEKGDRTLLGPREVKGFRNHVIKTKQILLHNENVEQAMIDFDNVILIGEKPKSQVYVPMIASGDVKGIISLQNVDHEQAFSDSDVNLLTTLANSMSVALESARLFDETTRLLKETEQRTAELSVINSVQDGLARELDISGIYELVGEKIREIFNAQVIDIVSYDKKTNQIEDCYTYEKGDRTLLGPRPLKGFRKHVIDSAKLLVINKNVDKQRSKYDQTVIVGKGAKSIVLVPMIASGEVTGVISLQNLDQENAFSDADVNLLTTLSNSMSVALESARLFDETTRLLKETEQRTAELAVINSVQEGLAKELDMQGIYDLIGDRVQKLFNAQSVIIATLDLDNKVEHFNYAIENGIKFKHESRPINKLRKLLIQKKHSIYIPTEEIARSEYGLSAIPGTIMSKSLLFVPLLSGNIIRGYVSLQNVDIENAFSESDIRLLETLANSMSVALENARLFDETNRLLKETEQRTAELAIINSVQEGLASKLEIQSIYDLVGDKIRDVFDTQGISIAYYDRQKNYITHPYYLFKGKRIELVGFELGKGLTSHIIQTAQPLLINEHAAERFKELGAVFAASENEDTTKSWLGVPLISGGKVNGTIRLENYERENAYSESDVSLLQTLANSMSVALENARLFDETNRLLNETEQRTAELAVINSVQEGLAKELDMQGIYNLIGDRLCELFPDTQTLVIRTFNFESGFEHWHYAKEKGLRQDVEPRPLNWNSKELIRTKKPLDIKRNYVETSKQHGGTGVTAGQPPKSAVFVPMLVGDVVKGSISLQNVDKEEAFTDSDLRLLTTITNSMSVALENARLFDETNRLLKETEQRTAELAVINSVQEGLAKELDMQGIYDLVGDRLCELFPDTQTLVIRTFDHANAIENFHYAIEKGERFPIDSRPFIWASKQLILDHKPIHINTDYVETAKKYGGTGVTKGKPPKSAVFVPMVVGDIVKGSVSLQNVDKENAFTDSDLRLLTTITNSMSVALENARLFDETTLLLAESKQRAAELSTVNSISKALAAQLDPDDLINMVGDQLKNLFKANIVYLAILDPKTKIISFPYQYGDNMQPLKLGEGLTSKIILTGDPILINKDLKKQRMEMGVSLVGIESASYLGVPIPVGDENIGVLSVQSTEHENLFNENDLRLLSTIGSSVGVALRNATLFEDVQQAKMEAEAASKLAEQANDAKSAFLSTVSHELRTPLTSVLGFAKIIKKRLEERIFPTINTTDTKIEKAVKQVSENLEVVISEGTRLTHLINDVLDLAKIEAGKMEFAKEDVSMLDVAERALAATTSLFEQKSLKLIRDIDNDLPEIIGDKDKLIQVMINLISNSVKFTDEGSITCSVHRVNNEIIASITDTGIGIALDDYGAVFEQFKQVGGDTLTDKPKGTGLGLPICKEIVEHLGGRIWLESKVGKGSTFSFALPIDKTVDSDARPIHLDDLVKQLKEQVANSQLNIIGTSSTILIVDDDESIRSLLHQELGDAGYHITEAANGKEALDCVRKHRPDLIILDIMMPEMNGFDVAAVLKNDPNTMDIPIIVLSVVQDKARGFRIGVDRYLTKPIDTNLLFSEVGSLLEQGHSRKKVMIVDEDSNAVNALSDVLKAKGYEVTDSKEKELVEKAKTNLPDIIIINSVLSGKQDIVQTLRFEKGLENVLFVVYQ